MDEIGSAELVQTRANRKMVESEGFKMQVNGIGVSFYTQLEQVSG